MYALDASTTPGFAQVWPTLPILLGGLALGVYVAIMGILIATILGAVVVVARLSPYAPLRWIGFAYTQFFRGVALYVLIVWVYYGLAVATSITLGLVATGVLCIALLNSAYLAEVYRSAIGSVDVGQIEAGKALGLSALQVATRVIGPQAARVALPNMGNYFVDAVKESAILSVIGLKELMTRTEYFAGVLNNPFSFYLTAAVLYLIATSSMTQLVRFAERSLAKRR